MNDALGSCLHGCQYFCLYVWSRDQVMPYLRCDEILLGGKRDGALVISSLSFHSLWRVQAGAASQPFQHGSLRDKASCGTKCLRLGLFQQCTRQECPASTVPLSQHRHMNKPWQR
eukprot:3908836-Amphidinium_carterae.1